MFSSAGNETVYTNDAGDVLGKVTYPSCGEGVVEIDHTFVDGSLRGQGIAGKLLEHAVASIKEQGLKVRPVCSYAVTWFEKHPEHADLLAE